MILSAQSIRRRCLEHSPPLITPFTERGVSPGGRSFGLSACSYYVRVDQRIIVRPHDFKLGSTLERFCLPTDLAGTVRDKSSLARIGLAVQNTHLDPGWYGYLTIELTNHSAFEAVIDAGEPVAQIIFELLDAPTEQPYSGKYQNRARGPQPARREMAPMGCRIENCQQQAERNLCPDHWFAMSPKLRRRWWCETDYSKARHRPS